MTFALTKHYFDAITPDGTVTVCYDASLHVRGIPWDFHYASRFHSPPHGDPSFRQWARSASIDGMSRDGVDEVAEVGQRIRVRSPDQSALSWTIRQRGWPQVVLLDDARRGFIAWQCRAPVCAVDRGDDAPWAVGYAETLRLRLPRLSFPIDRLHWGRFMAETSSLVWIVWEGREPRRLAWLNGAPAEISHFAGSGSGAVEILVSGADFSSTPVRDVVARPVANRLSIAMGWLAALMPRSIRMIEDRKQLGHGSLRLPNGETVWGWSLSESLILNPDHP